MSFWNLKTDTYANDVQVINRQALAVELDSIQGSKIGDAKNIENLTKILITDLGIDPTILDGNLTIVSDVVNDKVTLTYNDLRKRWQCLAFLQHIRMLTKHETDDLVAVNEGALATINSTTKLVLNSTPIIRSGVTNYKLQFDTVAGYPNEANGGLDIYERMFKERLDFLTNGEISITTFGIGVDDYISGSFDNPVTPTLYTVTFDLAASTPLKVETVYEISGLVEGGIPNTYEHLKTAGAVLAA